MPRPHLLRLGAAFGAIALLGACSSGDPTEDPTEVTTTTESPSAADTPTGTETSDTSDTATEGMTVDRAQEIVDATTAVYNDAVIRMLTEQRIDQQWLTQMKSIYENPMVEIIRAGWEQAAGREFDGYDTEDPTGVEDEVLEVITSSEDCVVVRIRREFDGVTTDGSDSASPPSDRYFLAFKQSTDSSRDGAGTGWIRAWDARFQDETPTDLCTRPNPGLGGTS